MLVKFCTLCTFYIYIYIYNYAKWQHSIYTQTQSTECSEQSTEELQFDRRDNSSIEAVVGTDSSANC